MSIQSELISKFIIQNKFKNELSIYLQGIQNDIKKINEFYNLDQVDFEQIEIKKLDNIKAYLIKISSLLEKGYSFRDIVKFFSKHDKINIKGGRVGWKNSRQIPKNLFNQLIEADEGQFIQFNNKNNVKLVRVIAKRINGTVSNREKIFSLIKINYKVDKNNRTKKFKDLIIFLSKSKIKRDCVNFSKQINNDIKYESKFIKLRLADLNEAIIKRIQNTNTKQLIQPFYFNKKRQHFMFVKYHLQEILSLA